MKIENSAMYWNSSSIIINLFVKLFSNTRAYLKNTPSKFQARPFLNQTVQEADEKAVNRILLLLPRSPSHSRFPIIPSIPIEFAIKISLPIGFLPIIVDIFPCEHHYGQRHGRHRWVEPALGFYDSGGRRSRWWGCRRDYTIEKDCYIPQCRCPWQCRKFLSILD